MLVLAISIHILHNIQNATCYIILFNTIIYNLKDNFVYFLTYKNEGKQNAHPHICVEPQNQVCYFCIYKTRGQIIYHGYTASLSCSYHDDNHEKKENFCLPLKKIQSIFIINITKKLDCLKVTHLHLQVYLPH